MRRKGRVVAGAAVLVAVTAIGGVVAVIGAGSGGTSGGGDTNTTAAADTTGTASSSGTARSAGNGANTNATDRAKAVKFSECVRENGVSDFPDPKPSGEFPDFGVSVSHEVWRRALRACKELRQPGSLSRVRNPEQQATALKFARCMREHGVTDFPDPVNGEPLVARRRIPSAATPGGMSVLNAAMDKCRDFLRYITAVAAGG
jgi:hypothetical protein